MNIATKAKVLFAATVLASTFIGGMSVRQPPITITRHVLVYQSLKPSKYFGEQRNKIAAVIPASALRPYKKGK